MTARKNNIITKGKNIAKNGAALSAFVFVFSFLAGFFVTSGSAINTLGNISVFSLLFLAFSVACLLLLQVESWERDWV